MTDLVPIGTTFTFTSPWTYGPSNMSVRHFEDRKGTTARVIGHIVESDENYDEEILPMYRIRFEDGLEIDAWPEEVEGA